MDPNNVIDLTDTIDDEQKQTESNNKDLVQVSRPTDDPEKPIVCPYLNTIDRRALDFDFEKLCSVSLSKNNVYACLVCGKYFQGRGRSTHAFTHSISEFHHVFLNLETLKIYCLPDNYEIKDDSLNDILFVLRPKFTKEDLETLPMLTKPVKAYDGKHYFPGIVGLNNLKYNDYCNVIFQALSHVKSYRDYFLDESNTTPTKPGHERYMLIQRFGELLRKLWCPQNFKAHVSPHEMLQAIVLTSKKRFEFTKQSDPIVFLGWFMNALLGPKREKNSIVKRTFQGKIRVSSRLLLPNVAAASSDDPQLIPSSEEDQTITSFLYLTLNLPTMPLFPKKDEKGKVIKPRVSVYELLKKFDGTTTHEFRNFKESSVKRYELLRLPPYLILYYERFTKNTFFTEKNTHMVDFPMNNLNMTQFLAEPDQSEETDHKPVGAHSYRLIANIVHDGEPDAGKGTYRVHILHKGTEKWFEMQDLYVTEISDTTLITLSEPYIQVWQRN